MRGGGGMVVFLFLHFFGLGGVIVLSLIHRMFDLALINGLVFLMLLRLEMVLCAKRYTVPMPVWADGTVGEAMEEMPSMERPALEQYEMESAVDQPKEMQQTPTRTELVAPSIPVAA